MATEAGTSNSENGKMSELTGASLLVIVGEPFSADHRELILERITKGLRSWDTSASGCDVNGELQSVATEAPAGVEGPHGERVIEHVGEKLRVDVIVNGTHQVVSNKLRHFLLVPAKQRYLLFAGHAFQGTGAWVLQDSQFTYKDFAAVVHEGAVEASLKQATGGSLTLQVFPEGEWSAAALAKQPLSKLLALTVNPADNPHVECSGLLQFTAYLSYFVKDRTVKELLQPSDVVGNIRFSRPTLYIFPGCQGDSSLFGISGFNLLINGGYSRKSCFWDFTRHLDRIDAMLVTHLGPDNLLGVSSLLHRKAKDNVHPELGFVYMNGVDEAPKHSPNGDSVPENGGVHKPASLLINLVEEGNMIYENLRSIVQVPSPCCGTVTGSALQPLSLYHKVGHGSLDMYVLNPMKESKELKEFLSQWSKHVNSFTSAKGPQPKASNKELGIPLPHMLSVCALLVWKPSNPSDNITRILFPGSAPQAKIFEGLDKLKNIDIFQQANCSEKSLHAGKPGGKKPPIGRTAKPAVSRAPPSKPEPKKPVGKTSPVPKASSPPKSTKDIKNTDKSAPRKKSSPSSTKSSTPTDMKEQESPKEPKPIRITKPEPKVEPTPEPVVTQEPEKAPVPEPIAEPAVEAQPVKMEEAALSEEMPVSPEIPETRADASSPEVESEPTTGEATTPDLLQQEAVTMDAMSSAPTADLLQMASEPAPQVQEMGQPQGQDDLLGYIQETNQSLPESQQDGIDLMGGQLPQDEQQEAMVPDVVGSALEEAAMPEADQITAQPVADPHLQPVTEMLDSPDPLPDPLDFSKQQPAAEVQAPLMEESHREVDNDFLTDEKAAKAEFMDEEKDIDTAAEAAHFSEAPVPTVAGMDQSELEDLGIYDEPEAEHMEQVQQQESAAAGDVYTEEPELGSPAAAETTSSAQPEADQGMFGGTALNRDLFGGAVPEGLPSPHEPELDLMEGDVMEGASSERMSEDLLQAPQHEDEQKVLEPEESTPSYDESEGKSSEPMTQAPAPVWFEPEGAMTAPPDAYADMAEAAAPHTEENQKYPEADAASAAPVEEQVPAPENPQEQISSSVEDAQQPQAASLEEPQQEQDDYPQEQDDYPPEQDDYPPEQDDYPLDDTSSVDSQERIPEQPFTKEQDEHIPPPAPEGFHTTPMETPEQHSVDESAAGREADEGSLIPPSEFDSRQEADDLPDVLGSSVGAQIEQHPVSEAAEEDQYEQEEPARGLVSEEMPTDCPPPQADPFAILDAPRDTHLSYDTQSAAINPFMGMGGGDEYQQPDLLGASDIPHSNGPLKPTSQITDPFEIPHDPTVAQVAEETGDVDRDSLEREETGDAFDPLQSWGQPMGLPAPATPKKDEGKTTTKSRPGAASKVGAGDAKKVGTTRSSTGTSRTTSAAKSQPAAKKDAPAKKEEPKEAKKNGALSTARKAAPSAAAAAARKTRPAASADKPATRPSTTPESKPATRPWTAPESKPASRTTVSKKTASSSATPAVRAPTPVKLSPVTPCYVDLTYIPAHGEPQYVNLDFFRRVRARYYVLSSLNPSPLILDALLEAKQTWENPELEVTLIPTYDTDTLHRWMNLHQDELNNNRITVAPSASRCTIQLQDHETSSSAYRLEF